MRDNTWVGPRDSCWAHACVCVCVQGFEGDLKWWDVTFWAERLREAKYSLNEEELRPYFALPNVSVVAHIRTHTHTHLASLMPV